MTSKSIQFQATDKLGHSTIKIGDKSIFFTHKKYNKNSSDLLKSYYRHVFDLPQ